MKKGFTLIELLAVITVLAIVLAIAVPKLSGINKKVRRSTFETNSNGIISVCRNHYQSNYASRLDANEIVYKIENGKITVDGVDVRYNEGEINEEGEIIINEDGESRGYVKNNEYCGIKEYKTSIEVHEMVEGEECGNTHQIYLTVELNGGSLEPSIEGSYTGGSSINLPSPTKENETFTRWVVTKGSASIEGNKLNLYHTDVTIYALYKVGVRLTVDKNGGSSSQEFQERYVTGSIIELEDLEKRGYLFTGWEIVSGDSILSGKTLTIGLEDTEIKGTFELASYTCSAGTYLKAGETSCSSCLAGSYCPGGTYPYNPDEDQGINECSNGTYSLGNASSCTLCVEGSTSSEGAEACTACQNGTTTSGDGQTSCNANCDNTSYVSEWNEAIWNNDNTMTNSCNIKTCVVGYVLNNNTCAEAIATNTVDGVTTYYLSLQEAIDASVTGEAKLLKDNTENVTVGSSINKTINLNGKVLTGTLTNNGTIILTGNGTITNSAEVIINNATLRIVNGTYTSTTTTDIDGAVKNISGDMIIDNATMDGGATNTIGVNDGTVIIEDITMTSNSTSIAMMSGGTGTLTINGGTITQTTGAAIYATSGNMGKVVINGGTINGGLLILSGTLNITGGRIYVTIQISNATATITGGTIETNGGNGIIIYSGATVRISGGTVKSNISNVPTVKIFSGGSFYMTNGTVRNTATSGSGAFYAVEKLNGGTCSITGGTVSKHNC